MTQPTDTAISESTTERPIDRSSARILVVDDEPANVALVRSVLLREGYRQVESTTRPDEVPDLFRRHIPDLVLLDLMMPRWDGYAVLDALHRLTPADDFVPVLVLTADTSSEARRRALALGASELVTKPIDVLELGLRVGKLLDLRLLVRKLQERAHGVALPPAS